MVVSITAGLVDAGDPAPVQIVITGVPVGVTYMVTGVTGAGSSWPVPGGVGVSTGSQIVLVDNRGALNTPITYQVLVDGVTYVADPVTVDYPDSAVIQSLDGQTSVALVWLANSLPLEPEVNVAAFQIPGRRRPVMMFGTGTDGGGSLEIRTTRENSQALRDLLYLGRPLVVRTDGTMRDWPAVELISPTGGQSRLWEAVEDGVMSTQRVWDIPFVFVDDPEPSRVLSAFTWADFNEAMTGRTWGDFNDLFEGSTWADFNTYDWGQLI